MPTTTSRGSSRPKARARWWILLAGLLAPLMVGVAVAGRAAGVWDLGFSLDVMTLTWARGLAWFGLVVAVLALILGLVRRGSPWPALASLAITAAALLLFYRHDASMTGGPWDVSTDPDTPPAFGPDYAAYHPSGAVSACPGVTAAPTQTAPAVAAYALKQGGFNPTGASVNRADGTREGFWFGVTHDAVVRIRPGRTDVRVASRARRDDGGEACRRLAKVIAELQEK